LQKLISTGEAAELAGVSVDTIRRWEKIGKIQSVRTDGNHRRYQRSDFVAKPEGITILYARVSSNDQRADLDRQAPVLKAYAESNDWE
jgi:excisionase family DNA binding protein